MGRKRDSSYVAVQDVRTRETREFIKGIGVKIKESLKGKPLSPKLEEELTEIEKDDTNKIVHLKLLVEKLIGARKLTEIIIQMKWILYENHTTIPLWTSDHPINRYNPIDLSPFGNLGLKSKGIQVFFPLTPTLGMLFCDPIEYMLEPDKIECIKDNITFFNALQVIKSTRAIFLQMAILP